MPRAPRSVKMWVVQGNRKRSSPGGWHGVEQIPTFFLHPDVQGIQTEAHAVRIAESMLGPGYYRAALVDVYVDGPMAYSNL